ncbi:MAG TPA: hypothetical protein VMW87_06855 [Spirochaetia bacterium]|nr:hypothetical protein [Spirochaetia bacterium]
MRKWIIAMCAVAVLASCASFPSPEGPQSTLVVGNLRLEFPDGFFGMAPRTIENSIRLKFTDVTTETSFTVLTSGGGYFYFDANPGDTYRFESWDGSSETSQGRVSLGPAMVGAQFPAVPGKIVYFPHLLFTFASPKRAQTTGENSSWHYKISHSAESRPEEVRQFLLRNPEGMAWMSHDLVTVSFTRGQ